MSFTPIKKSSKQCSRFSNVNVLHNFSDQNQEINIDTILFVANKLDADFTTSPAEFPGLSQGDTLLSCLFQDQSCSA